MTTTLRTLNTINKKKRILLEFVGYKSINGFKKDNPEFNNKTNDDTYKYLLDLYNDKVEELKEEMKQNKIEEDRLKKEQLKQMNKKPKLLKIKVKIKVKKNIVKLNPFDIDENYKTIINSKKNMLVILKLGSKKQQINIDVNMNKNYNWKKFRTFLMYDSNISKPEYYAEYIGNKKDVSLYLIYGKDIKKNKVNQSFKDGKFNCVLKPIKDFILNKIETSKNKKTIQNYNTRLNKVNKLNDKYYDIGVNIDGLNDIANILQVDLNVNLPFENEFLTAKSNKKPLRKFNYINTRLNHIDYDELSYDDKEVILTQEDLNKLQRELDFNKTYYTYNKNIDNINIIRTIDTIYRLDNDFNETIKQFEIDTGLIDCKICDIKNKDLSTFIRQGNHFNETVDGDNYCNIFNGNNDFNVIDMKKAYINYSECKFYKGFVGKITDFRKCDHIVDIGYYRICNLNFSKSKFMNKWNTFLDIYNNYNVYFSAELEMLNHYGVSFDIIEGAYGNKIDFKFNDKIINSKDESENRYYCKYVGRMFCKNLIKSLYIKGDNNFIQNLYSEIDCDRIQEYNGEYRIMYDKKSNYHLSHISGGITAYVRMMMLEQLEQFEVDDIYRICVDGIYFKPKNIELKNVFRYEDDKEVKNNCAGDTYISNNRDLEYEKYPNYLELGKWRDYNNIELHLGGGGCGKTYYNIYDKGLINPTYYAPSWKLVRSKQKESGMSSTTIAKITTKDIKIYGNQRRFCNVCIIDEVSMMTDKEKNTIIKNMKGCKIVFCGDINYQLPPIIKDGEDEEEFKIDNIKTYYHTKNYRVKCNKLKDILETCRKMMEYGYNIKSYVMKCFKNIEKDEMDYDYKKDMIICSTHINKNYYTEKYKNHNKYYITKSDRIYGRGEILLDIPKNTEHYELRHAYTIHSIQGETAEGKLFIDMDKCYENRMIYTAISRARRLEQIYLITEKPEIYDINDKDECCVCYEKTIKKCKNGHHTCRKCCFKICNGKKCPICRIPINLS